MEKFNVGVNDYFFFNFLKDTVMVSKCTSYFEQFY